MSESGDLARQVSVMCDKSESSQTSYMTYTRNILDCDQSNVLLARIIFLLYSFNCFLVPFFSHWNDVIGHVTIRLPGVDFLSVVHSDHASI